MPTARSPFIMSSKEKNNNADLSRKNTFQRMLDLERKNKVRRHIAIAQTPAVQTTSIPILTYPSAVEAHANLTSNAASSHTFNDSCESSRLDSNFTSSHVNTKYRPSNEHPRPLRLHPADQT